MRLVKKKKKKRHTSTGHRASLWLDVRVSAVLVLTTLEEGEEGAEGEEERGGPTMRRVRIMINQGLFTEVHSL